MSSKYTPEDYSINTYNLKNQIIQNNSIITLIDALGIIKEQVIYEGNWKRQSQAASGL